MTCALGHPMADGQMACPICGMAPMMASVAAPAAAASAPPSSPPVMSPDGQWMWNGSQWLPAAAMQAPPPPAAYGYPGAGAPIYGQAPATGTNGMAIASLVLGILWLYGLGSLLAVIFGHVAKKQIRERGQGGSGLSTAGLVLGYVGLAGALIIIIFVGGVLTAFNSQLNDEHAASVKSDLRNAATAEETFLTDYDTYTTSITNLEAEGMFRSTGVQIAVGADGNRGYCIVGSYNGNGDWYLYDSAAIGLQSTTYSSVTDAELACSDSSATFSGVG